MPVFAKNEIEIWKSDLAMEFNEKLQELRKAKGMTQEDLAQSLYVSRTAISKWESGRGYPNIDSLKAISKFFGVSIDDLLSGEELLTLAEADNRQKERHLCDVVYGLLDSSAAMLFFLPFFGQMEQGTIRAVSLLSLTQAASYLRTAYSVLVGGTAFSGILQLTLQNSQDRFWRQVLNRISLAVSVSGTLLFIISSQPYAATLLFVFLSIKVLLLMKWQ